MKADGCDLTCGLGESIKSKCSGNVNLNDGKPKEVSEAYTKQLEFVKQVGMGSPDTAHLLHDIDTCIDQIKEDLDFITFKTAGYDANNNCCAMFGPSMLTVAPKSAKFARLALENCTNIYFSRFDASENLQLTL